MLIRSHPPPTPTCNRKILYFLIFKPFTIETTPNCLYERGGKRKRDSWFRKNNNTSIIRVPYIRGELKERINNILMQPDSAPLGTKTVVQEESGTKLKDMLVRSDPFPMLTCNREDCHTVVDKNSEIGQCSNTCWQQHVNYTVTCKIS